MEILTAGKATNYEIDKQKINRNFNQLIGTWEDENLDPSMLTGGGTLPSRIAFATTGIGIAGFSAVLDDSVEGCREYPHKARLNATGETSVYMSFHAHCYPTTALGGNIRLGLEYFWTVENVATTSSNTIYVTMAVGTTAWAKKTATFANIPVPSVLGGQFHFRFFRAATDVLDTYAGTLGVATVGMHYEIDSTGSQEILVK